MCMWACGPFLRRLARLLVQLGNECMEHQGVTLHCEPINLQHSFAATTHSHIQLEHCARHTIQIDGKAQFCNYRRLCIHSGTHSTDRLASLNCLQSTTSKPKKSNRNCTRYCAPETSYADNSTVLAYFCRSLPASCALPEAYSAAPEAVFPA